MRVVIRTYAGKGAAQLFDALEKNAQEVQSAMGQVTGLVSYTLARTSDGGFAVTVCHDQAGIDESVKIAREWIARNAGDTGVAAPELSQGVVIARVG